MACHIGEPSFADAIDMRAYPKRSFNETVLEMAAGYRSDRDSLTSILFQLQSSIIKVREQVQQLRKELRPEGFSWEGRCEQASENTVKGKDAKRKEELMHRFRTGLLTAYGQACWYCGTPLTPESATVDTVIPTYLKHQQQSIGLRYYLANDEIKNAVPCCLDCNFVKGREETAVRYLHNMLSWECVQSQGKPDVNRLPGLFDAGGRVFGKTVAQAPTRYARNQQISLATLHALATTLLRVAKVCYCNSETLVVRPCVQLRSILIGCPVCLPPRRFAGAVFKRPYQKSRGTETEEQCITYQKLFLASDYRKELLCAR